MKKLFFLLPVFVLVLMFAAQCAPRKDKGIVFTESTWQEVLNKAKAERKPIFLDIYASWCGPCKMLRNQTFTDRKAGEFFNANFINASFDGEKEDGVMLAEKYSIEAYPSLFILDSDGNVLTNSVGFLTAKELVNFGKRVVNK